MKTFFFFLPRATEQRRHRSWNLWCAGEAESTDGVCKVQNPSTRLNVLLDAKTTKNQKYCYKESDTTVETFQSDHNSAWASGSLQIVICDFRCNSATTWRMLIHWSETPTISSCSIKGRLTFSRPFSDDCKSRRSAKQLRPVLSGRNLSSVEPSKARSRLTLSRNSVLQKTHLLLKFLILPQEVWLISKTKRSVLMTAVALTRCQ